MLYTMVEFSRKNVLPLKNFANMLQVYQSSPLNIFKGTEIDRLLNANLEFTDRFLKEYSKPEFGINSVKIGTKDIKIVEDVVMRKRFCNLIHFRKISEKYQNLPKLLIVAPLSGHHATLLRGTVKDTLPHFDVYITDWIDASKVPMAHGKFDLDDYIYYTKDFMNNLGPNLSVMAVCQPVVPVLAAVCLLEEEGRTPVDNMILMGGPVDARKSSTQVTKFAENRSMNWFETNVITRVPINYPGFGRPVYPGFIQLFGFMAMNMQRHVGEHFKLYQHLVVGDGDSADQHIKFYDEYLSVLDVTAEYYLQTIKTVFKDFDLPKGKMLVGDRKVKPEAVKHAALLCIEGELDDISGIGQTKAAIDICTHIPKSRSHYHLQKGVGHYGVFNGRKFRESIVPVIKDFCYKNIRD
ncbi:MAG: polyhydroxyalkanoate depolymerase [Alphaproteobacteria bacterium]|nr:polyhydroxyalkanoate depolymerase [Alphaproteobacteria bacterium]OJV13531.1 MAG: hypothetical protein BGO27_04600 [Alphaproteobacteria bacterium 33-17]